MVKRLLSPPSERSFFLFGARGTGKTSVLRERYPERENIWFDLLDPRTEERLILDPASFRAEIEEKLGTFSWVIVDEVQKCPKLLNIVHLLIESRKLKFALTGSSARRLKQKGTNLLAGRAFWRELYPLTHVELGQDFDLSQALRFGTLPEMTSLQTEMDRFEYLESYALSYVKSEVQVEQWVRKLEPFRRFLPIAVQQNGQIINCLNIAKDVGADSTTVRSYFEILEDTLLGRELPAHDRSVRKSQKKGSKFYFFDLGVMRSLGKTIRNPLLPRTVEYGMLFETFIFNEMVRLNSYGQHQFEFSYVNTKNEAEIDFVVTRPRLPTALIEVKSSERVDERDCRGLERFKAAFKKSELFLFSLDPKPKKFGSVRALPWQLGFQEIGLCG